MPNCVTFVPRLAIVALPNVASTTTSIVVGVLSLVGGVPSLAVRCRWQWRNIITLYLLEERITATGFL